MTDIPPVTAEFAQGYALAFMDDDPKRDARWKSVNEIASTADVTTIEVLARLAFRTTAQPSGFKDDALAAALEAICDVMRTNDGEFNPSTNTRAMEVLAAFILREMFTRYANASLAVTTTSFGGARKPDLPIDLVGLAENAIVSLARSRHVRPDESQFKIEAPKLGFEIAKDVIAPEQWKDEFSRLKLAVEKGIATIVQRQNKALEASHQYMRIADEELEMLWWLVGGRSVDLKSAFEEVDNNIRPLVFGRELARLTFQTPGPVSIGSLLSRAGAGSEKLKITDAIAAVSLQWAEAATKRGATSPATTPIHYGLEKRAELNSNDAWISGWVAATGLAEDLQLSGREIGELFYREHLFLTVGGG